MNLSKPRLVLVAFLLCASGAIARGADPEAWISLGADTLPAVQAALEKAGQGAFAVPTDKVGDVVVLHLRESQLPLVGEVMHDRFNRCAGFLSHESRQKAVAEVNAAALRAATIQPLAVTYTVDNGAVVNSLIGQMTAANIEDTITNMAAFNNRYYTAQTGVDAANWLRSRWQGYAAGRSDITVDLFAHSWAQPSVIMTILGTTSPSEVVVLGGHLDSINQSSPSTGRAPGADDDASGVASITEVIRVALAQNYRPQKTVKFMAYAAEEVGLRGSQAIASSYQAGGVNVIGALQLDMTNYKGSSIDMAILTDNTNAAQNNFLISLLTTYLPTLTYGNTSCGYGCSDHVSWTNIGVPASLPFESLLNQDNPNIHTANDTLANSGGNANHALKFSKLAAAYLAELAKGNFNGSGPVGAIATYDATLKAPKCGSAGAWCESGTLLNGRAALGPEVNQPNTIAASCADGASGTFHSDESNDWLRVSTLDGTNLAAGKTAKIEARAWVYSTSADKLDLYYAANANSPTWTFLATITPTATGAQTMSATYTLPSGALQAVRAQFRYQGAAGTCTAGNYNDRDDLAFAVEGGTPDTTPPTVSITAPAGGSTVSGTVTISANASDNVGVAQVEFLVDGVVKGTDTSSPYSYAWDSTTAANGSHSLTARATDGAGNATTSAAVSVTVSNSGVAYDTVLKAPKCASVGSVCDSGTLLTGRKTLGPELNQPNTINTSCADGASGTFHTDESNDRLKVSTTDGTPFAAGKSVRVDATVWAYSTFTSDKLDLYYAANASSPTWTLIGTFSPTAGGSQTLSATYTLPSGTLQAVRARFRYQGTAGSCGAGNYDDHDDLIFAVQ
ncbi:MAG TPA: M20/M25/M40 family metallo-hydrolase [Myxococcaceae bacterium]|jgi:leucyl aminopeptidase